MAVALRTDDIARDQRARMLRAMGDVVAEKGYAAATVADVVRAAGVSRTTFYEQFRSKEDCFVEPYRHGVDVLIDAVRAAVRATPGDWREQLRAGMRAYLGALAADRRFARTYLLELLLAGPTIMIWGTDEQKDRYLAPLLSADEIWCQGFSEPDAGSDLASLKTRATKHGDEFVVTGQKVWTSGAQYSKWCMLVARTDGEAPKHKGLTYFLMDMEQEAVQVRPLRQITGEAEFNELFIEEARIPEENVVGGVGDGWGAGITTLTHERAERTYPHHEARRAGA